MVTSIKHLPDPYLRGENWQAIHVLYFKKAVTNNVVKVDFFKTAFYCDKKYIQAISHLFIESK